MKKYERKQSLAWASALMVACSLAACGGGGGGGDTNASAPAPAPAPGPAPAPAPAADTTPPTIIAFLPATATGVARTSEISATFSEALAAGTVTDANLRLTRGTAAVAGTLSYDAAGHKASFQPQQPLDLLASYTVTAGTGLQDVAGNALAEERAWTFQTADGNWRSALRLEAGTAASVQPDIAIDADGNAVATWSTPGPAGAYEIRSATSSAGGAWSTAVTVSAAGSANAFYPKVRFDGQGNGLAVWTQGSTLPGAVASAWSARYLKGQGWQAAVALDTGLAGTVEPSLAVDAAGNAFAVWAKPVNANGTGNADIWAARFTPAGGWQAAARLGSGANIGTYDQADQPQVAVDAAGNAYVLWIQAASDNPVWFARYQAGSGWTPAVSLGATRLGDPYAPRLAVSASGQVMALWNSFVYAGGPYRFDLWWSTLANGSWSTPALLENDDAGDARGQAVVADSQGRFHAVWQQFASTYNSNILHRQYTAGTGWSTVATLSTAGGTYDQNRSPSLVADRNGNLMAAWSVYASGYAGAQQGTFARRYTAAGGWQAATRLDNGQGGYALATALAINPSGLIAAGWMEPAAFRGDGPVWASVFQ